MVVITAALVWHVDAADMAALVAASAHGSVLIKQELQAVGVLRLACVLTAARCCH